MTIAELVVSIAVKLEGVNENFSQASAKLEEFFAGTEKTQAQFKKFGIAAGVAGTAIVGAFALMAREAGQAEVVLARLGEAAAASTQKIDVKRLQEFAKALQRVRAVTDEEILSATRFLVSAQLTQQQIEQLIPRILNLATTLQIGPDAAAQALAKSMTIGTSALRRMGLVIDETIDPVRDFTGFLQALDQATGESSEAFAKTLPGALLILRNNFSELAEVVGTHLVPRIKALAGFLTDLTIRFQQFATDNPLLIKTLLAIGGAFAGILLIASPILLFLASIATIIAGVAAAGGLVAVLTVSATVVAVIAGVVASLVLLRETFTRIVELGKRFGLIPPIQRSITEETSHHREVVEATNRAIREQQQTLEQIDARYKTINASLERQANLTQQVATEQATSAFRTGGLTEGDLAAIEERKTRAFIEGERDRLRALQMSLATQRAEIIKTAVANPGEKDIDFTRRRDQKIAELDADLSKTRLQIAETYQTEAAKIANDIVGAERDAAAARLDLYRTELQVRTDLTRQSSDIAVQAARDQVDALSDIRQAELARFQLVEETRLGLLRRSIDTEITLRKNAVTIQEAQNRLATTRERRSLEIRNAIRADLVKQGFFSQAEADDIARAEEDKIATAGLQREIELERQKLALSESTAQREIQLALAERDSRLNILGAETEARKAQIRLNAQLRIFDLQNAVLVAKAETEAKILELRAQAKAQIELRKAELEGRRARGLLTPDEDNARQAEIAAIARGAGLQEAALLEGQQKREELLTRTTASVNDQVLRQTLAADQELATRRAGIAQESALAIAKIESDRLVNLETGLAHIAELEAQIPDRLGATVNTIVGVAQSGMRTLTDLFTTFANGATGVLKPLADLIDKIKSGAGGGFSIPGVPSAPNVPTITPPAPGGFAPGQQQFSQVINVNGTQAHFQGDRQALVETALQMLLGPEGARAFDEFMRRRPGPRTSTAGG